MCSWHQFHTDAIREINKHLSRREKLILAAPALVESYSVLTRLPSPHRLAPEIAGWLLRENYSLRYDTVTLDARRYENVIEHAAQSQIAGGAIYDLVILECARSSGARILLTFNPRHFERIADASIEIIVPEP